MSNEENYISPEEYKYLVYMLIVKIIGFLQLNRNHIENFVLTNVIEELNLFYNGTYTFNENNIITLGKEIIDTKFSFFIDCMIEGTINPELEITQKKQKQIQENLAKDKKNKNYKNLGDMLSDYPNGKYYRFFRNMAYMIETYDCDRTDIGAGETIYHSFSRFYAEGVEEYLKYFKIMDHLNLINHQNQNQERGFCNNVPCTYWFLNSKENLKYYNQLLLSNKLKLNHIAGNEHGPSSFSIIADFLKKECYWDRLKNKTLNLTEEHKEILLETIFNIVKSNYSIAYDYEQALELFNLFKDNIYIQESIEYLTSEIGIESQIKNNQYPIYRGGKKDKFVTEETLNKQLYILISSLKKLSKKKTLTKK